MTALPRPGGRRQAAQPVPARRAVAVPPVPVRRPLAARRQAEALGLGCLTAAAALALAPGLLALGWLAWRGAPALSWRFLTSPPQQLLRAGGIGPALAGSFYLVLGALAVAVPLGMAVAVYLAEYARPGPGATILRGALTNLAGVPSVVFGLFGLALFVKGLGLGVSVAAGALTLALLVLPTMTVAAEAALRAVPRAYREAALALGASPWQAVSRAVLPFALPGMLTGALLAAGRAAGEAAPLLFTAAAFWRSGPPQSLLDRTMALPYHLYVAATQVPGMPVERLYGAALTLVALVLAVNLSAMLAWAWYRRR